MLFFGGLFLVHKRATTHEAEDAVVVVGGGWGGFVLRYVLVMLDREKLKRQPAPASCCEQAELRENTPPSHPRFTAGSDNASLRDMAGCICYLAFFENVV